MKLKVKLKVKLIVKLKVKHKVKLNPCYIYLALKRNHFVICCLEKQVSHFALKVSCEFLSKYPKCGEKSYTLIVISVKQNYIYISCISRENFDAMKILNMS